MRSVSSLTDFYYKELFAPLQKLEARRKRLKQTIVFTAVALSAVFAIAAAVVKNHYELIIAAYLAIGGVVYKFMLRDYTQEFKIKVIKPLIHAIDENLLYSSRTHVSDYCFERSGLFDKPDRLSGNDYVEGVIDGVNIRFSDIYAEQKHRNSKDKDTWSTIFEGLFLVADFNKHFRGATVVLPDTAQNGFGDIIGHWLQSNNTSRDELVKMDDPEFEKEFVVYSNDQIEARYILSHALMKKLLDFKKRAEHPIYISFVDTRIYIAINYGKDLFEPSVFNSLLEYKTAMEYVKTLHQAIGVIQELRLNQKLWSKI